MIKEKITLRISLLLPLFLPLAGCFGSVGSKIAAGSTGSFEFVSTNVSDGDVWELNRPIVLSFNHPVDEASIGFASIRLRALDSAVLGNPVTGSFEILAGSGGLAVVFRPTCPTNLSNSNGAFVPGGYNYEINLPTSQSFGASILRDTDGRPLAIGVTRTFRSPIDPVEPLFIDTKAGPVVLDPQLVAPSGLNMFTDSGPLVEIKFDQPINAEPGNLNTSLIRLLYSDSEIGLGSENSYNPANVVPGQVVLKNNCTATGATVYYIVAGLLLPNRNYRVELDAAFEDLSGQTNSQQQESLPFASPSLDSYYSSTGGFLDSEDETYDELRDFFADSTLLDADAELEFPSADFNFGSVTAAFDYPGEQVDAGLDLYVAPFQSIELNTTGHFSFTDSNGTYFEMQDGVLEIDDFFIDDTAYLRGYGDNPLIIYATGEAEIKGILDVSGDHAITPPTITFPTIPELGASGQCGGGDGGDASQETASETLRAGRGSGAFSLGLGGGGGEASLNWQSDDHSPRFEAEIAGGGAGGTFAMTTNSSVTWSQWDGASNPEGFDDSGPDLRIDRHTVFDDGTGAIDMAAVAAWFSGGEDGLRGNSWRDANTNEPPPAGQGPLGQYGGYGMEDMERDEDVNDRNDLDPAWTANGPLSADPEPQFGYGHPTQGADPGFTNSSVFVKTSSTNDDFWGKRYNGFDIPPSLLVGELATPWAGVGGGGSGDSSVVIRMDLDLDSFLDPLSDFFPDTQFPNGTTVDYYKGAAGGGGGGQLQLMTIGPIILGPNAKIMANGGSGAGGESNWALTTQVSGSGGGSGGHIIINSASGLDISAIDLGATPETAVPLDLIQAIGGRRGWAGSELITVSGGGDGDGNSDFLIGRGGAGSNGVIQIHIPEPLSDIGWHVNSDAGAKDYLTHSNLTGPVDTGRLEDLLDKVCEPRAYALVPVYSPKTQIQTVWFDTGLAGVRAPANAAGPWPAFSNAVQFFAGTDVTTGQVLSSGDNVVPGSTVAIGSTVTAIITTNQVTIYNVSALPVSDAFAGQLLLNPHLMEGYDFWPDASGATSFEIVDALYVASSDVLVLSTSASDGDLTVAVNPSNPVWEVREKFLRLTTSGFKDRLPSQAGVAFEFQAASDADNPVTFTSWTTDPTDGLTLDGLRFVRMRITFDINAGMGGLGLGNERPSLEYYKVPFGF